MDCFGGTFLILLVSAVTVESESDTTSEVRWYCDQIILCQMQEALFPAKGSARNNNYNYLVAHSFFHGVLDYSKHLF